MIYRINRLQCVLGGCCFITSYKQVVNGRTVGNFSVNCLFGIRHAFTYSDKNHEFIRNSGLYNKKYDKPE
ncbi:hypothetical protein THMIRHAM_07540 [Thiomicrorhabdus immobilis]|uniref:Uncharacterized protein n=1 Tax=Thiomicrorhabdus immobilis TaxID=2791037 RepID=A0ABN6CWE3_9GAMM|nr:hypothetical protein THMIRHAM_07540 [Thiomicrorhabdus immobilis]